MFERIVIATRNEGKRKELEEILRDALDRPITVLTAADVDLPEVVENGVTFAANAELKARSAAAHTGLPAIADDSGLTVDVLGGAPGIFSARWSGRHGDDIANYELLLAQLAEFPAVVGSAARLREPHRVARHLEVVAGAYHAWYAACRIVPMPTEDGTPRPVETVNRTRLWLNDATAQVLANGLGLLGVSAPEKM